MLRASSDRRCASSGSSSRLRGHQVDRSPAMRVRSDVTMRAGALARSRSSSRWVRESTARWLTAKKPSRCRRRSTGAIAEDAGVVDQHVQRSARSRNSRASSRIGLLGSRRSASSHSACHRRSESRGASASPRAGSRATRNTLAPRRASSTAVTRPEPAVAPVTRQVLPSRVQSGTFGRYRPRTTSSSPERRLPVA